MFKTFMATAAVAAVLLSGALVFAQDEAAPVKAKPRAFIFQDNTVTYAYGNHFHDPFTVKKDNDMKAAEISKHMVNFVHADIGNTLGDNTFVFSYMSSNLANSTSNAFFHGYTGVGAKDVYITYRHDIVLSRIFGRSFAFGPVKDVFIETGADYGAKNDDFGNQRRSPFIGPGVSFKVPNGGYWKVAAMWSREWNNEGTDVTSWQYINNTYPTTVYKGNAYGACFSPVAAPTGCTIKPLTWGKPVVYDHEATVQTVWNLPFGLGSAPISWEGVGVLNAAKGYGAGSLAPYHNDGTLVFKGTKPEMRIQSFLTYNIGSLFKGSHLWQIGGGYIYWNNMYGVDHHIHNPNMGGDASSLQRAPVFILQVHL